MVEVILNRAFVSAGHKDKLLDAGGSEIGKIDEATARKLPSHPDNAALLLPVDIEWYAKFEQKASAMYQDLVTE